MARLNYASIEKSRVTHWRRLLGACMVTGAVTWAILAGAELSVNPSSALDERIPLAGQKQANALKRG
jgi:hypothetical protein